MPRLIVCTSCNAHFKVGDPTCPHCDAPAPDAGRVVKSASAVLMGLSLAGCPAGDDSDPTTTAEPEYGVPATESISETTPMTTMPADDSSGGTGEMTTGPMTTGEAEYGAAGLDDDDFKLEDKEPEPPKPKR